MSAAVAVSVFLGLPDARSATTATEFVITNGSVTFQDGSTSISLNASNLSLNLGTRFFGFFLPCASGCPEGSQVFQTGLANELSRGNVEFNGRSTFVSFIDSFHFAGVVTIPSTTDIEVTARGRFGFVGILGFDDFSDPLVVRRVNARLLGSGTVSMPLRQIEPGKFVSAGPHRYDFLPILDLDVDGVADLQDECPNTAIGAIVDSHGCSIEQYAPCSGPAEGGAWRNHGQYVVTVIEAARLFVDLGLIDSQQRDAIIAAAGQSECGK
jgi:hypothetical protein